MIKLVAFLIVAGLAVQAQTDKVKVSKQLQQEAVELENKVCADATYKPDCNQLRKADGDALKAALAKFKPDSLEVKQAEQKIETDAFALEDKLYVDPKYSAAYKHIQLLHDQLGLPHHGKSK